MLHVPSSLQAQPTIADISEAVTCDPSITSSSSDQASKYHLHGMNPIDPSRTECAPIDIAIRRLDILR
jgi:hypothetical protein